MGHPLCWQFFYSAVGKKITGPYFTKKKVPPQGSTFFIQVFCYYLSSFLASAFWLNLYINGVATNIEE